MRHAMVQVADLTDVEATVSSHICVTETLDDQWLDSFCQLSEIAEHDKKTLRRQLVAIVHQTFYLSLVHAGHVVACGLGVLERNYLGLFDFITDREYRRQGFGEQTVRQLLSLGKKHGAEYAYLQVLADNTTAQQLYAKLGFREVYPYWYRVKNPKK